MYNIGLPAPHIAITKLEGSREIGESLKKVAKLKLTDIFKICLKKFIVPNKVSKSFKNIEYRIFFK